MFGFCNTKCNLQQGNSSLLVSKHASLLTGDLSNMERSDGERNERQRRSESTPNGTGSEYDSAESGAYSGDDYDDSAYGTMARFVPTLVLERLRSEGEAAMSKQPSGAAEAVVDAAEGANVPKVSSSLWCPLAAIDTCSLRHFFQLLGHSSVSVFIFPVTNTSMVWSCSFPTPPGCSVCRVPGTI